MESPTSKPLIGVIIVDPTVLNTRERLFAFLESMIYRKHIAILPSLISSSIQKGDWNELTSVLRKWEWNLDRSKSEEWFESSDFKRLCRQLDEVCVSFERIREDLSPEERELLSRVREMLRYDSPEVVKLAKELITIAITTRGGIVSYTRHLKRWLKSLRRVIILEISEKINMLSETKAEIKDKIRNAGWKGTIFVTSLEITTAVALASVFPPLINWIVDSFLIEMGEKATELIVGVVIDGR
ncbi:MAG: hypothetical protein JSV12_00310 [Candidatus Bathyarchaeota archaeon]|nr:MAG: hypothetical protein JSV12_00310 [Candidatus Bathyarchaeota archaeon]